jgi:hypothetical protein
MLVTLKTFDGHNINDGSDYEAAVLGIGSPQNASPIFVQLANADSKYAGVYSVDIKNIPVNIYIRNYSDRYALIAQLKTWLKPSTSGYLVVTFNDETIDYQIEASVQSLVQDKTYPDHFTAILLAASSTWRAVEVDTADTWTVTASGQKKEITVGGFDNTKLSVDITPTELPEVGYAYQNLYQLVNVPAVNYGVRPWCITLNTAALITAEKMQADCDDLRVVIGGKQVHRWIGAPNTTTTKVWFNLNIGPGYSLVLKTPVSDSGTITELAFSLTVINQTIFKALPPSGLIYHGTEWFEYTSKNIISYKLQIKTRGALGTTQAAHSAGAVFKYIQTPIWIFYGNSAVSAPSTDDSTYDYDKPVFNLVDSDNTKWVYDATTVFYDPYHKNRPGSWTYSGKVIGTVSNIYIIKGDEGSGDPALGIKAGSWISGGKPKAGYVEFYWQLISPGGFYRVSATGRKYYYLKWPATVYPATLQYCPLTGTYWSNVWSEAIPTVQSTWQSITQNNKTIALYAAKIRFGFVGSMAAVLNAIAYFEILTCTVEFYSTNLPAGTLLGEQSNVLIDFILRNNTTGDAINLCFPVRVDKILSLDGENYIINYNGANALGALELDDQSRDVWIRLKAGVNELEVISDYIGELDFDLSWYARRL